MSAMDPSLRIGDEDRERVAERLRTAAGEGRLASEELEERLEAAFGARTAAELEPLVADLPSEAPARSPRRNRELRPFVATSILLIAIWALSGAGYFWPVWPILGWGLVVVGPAGMPGTLTACRRNASWRP